MSSAAVSAVPPLLPRPSLFISYASEDRAAARRLRDAMEAAGLDVWYDENELGGGDAWDAKIRRQIRECTYFMPLISAATERRREGYFRREWRLAVERTLDMADDVMFLLPVALDATPEGGARVPERFVSVQWLRCPEGTPTPALTALCARLVAGEATPPPALLSSFSRPPVAPRAAAGAAPGPVAAAQRKAKTDEAEATHAGPPPMPPFPQEHGHKLKYYAEVVWWLLGAGWLLFRRMPKWLRTLLTIWFVVTLFSRCGSSSSSPSRDQARPSAAEEAAPVSRKSPPARPEPATDPAVEAAELKRGFAEAAAELSRVAAENRDSTIGSGLARIGSTIAGQIAAGIPQPPALDGLGAGSVAIEPFASGASDPAAARFADGLYADTLALLAPDLGGQLAPQPRAAMPASDADALSAARAARHAWLLRPTFATADEEPALILRLLRVSDGAVSWTERFPVAAESGETVSAAAARIRAAVALARRPEPPPAAPAATP